MAYLGRQPNTGVRSRYIYTATASQTTFTGSDDDGKTLKYEDAAYLDVFLNGVLLKPVTDYTATSKTSVVLTSGAAASDVVEIVAYDIANIADTVSKANGGTFDADVSVNGTVTSTGSTVNGTVTSDALNVSAASPNIDVTDTGTSHASQDFLTNSSTVRATIGVENSTGGGLFVGSSPYAAVFGTASAGNAQFATNNNVRMTLDSSGNVGIGTTSPTFTSGYGGVHINKDYAELHMTNSVSGTTNTDGFKIQQNSANNTYLWNYENAFIALGTNNSERARIISNGATLFGTTSEYASNQTVQVNCDAVASNGSGILTRCAATSVIYHINFRNGNGGVGGIYTTGTSTGYNTASDYRLKENIVDLDGAIDRVKQLPARRFNFIADPDTTVDGFVAHEVADVVPEAITGTKDEVDEEGNPVYQGIDQSKLVPLLTAAIKEQQALIEDLQTRLATLENA